MKKLKLFSLALMALFTTCAWATALSSLSFSEPTTLPTSYVYNSANSPAIATWQSKSCINVSSGGSPSYDAAAFTKDGFDKTKGKRWMGFITDKASNLVITCGEASTSRKLLLYQSDGTKYAEYSITATNKWEEWELNNLPAGKYILIPNNSNAYVVSMQFTSVCDAETPGTITKGTLSEGNLQLVVSDKTPSTNNVWYWQTSADGEMTNNPYDAENPRTVNTAGTYYLRSYYNSSCWGDASSITISAADLVENYTVVYKDGETPLGSETVEVGQKPTASGISTTKDFYTFAAWQLGGVDKALTDDSWALVEANATVTLTARWTALYTSGNYVFENNATVGTNPSKTVTTTKTTYPAFHIDNIYFDGMDIEYEGGVYPGQGDDFNGWKIKSAAKTIRFLVENNSQVTAQMGNLTSGCNITYTPITGAATTEALAAKTANKYNVKAGTIVTLTTQGSSTVTLKQIAVVPVYAVTCADAENGSVSTDKAQAIEGETVTLTATPDDGYKIASVKYNDGSDHVIEPVESVYSFTMPAAAVTVSATFYYPYVVTYDANGGECATESQTFAGTALTLPVATNSPKYFAGWYDDAEAGNKIGMNGDAYIPTADIILYAHWSDTPTALDNTEDEVKAVKVLENGMLIIEKNGVRYNAQGQVLR